MNIKLYKFLKRSVSLIIFIATFQNAWANEFVINKKDAITLTKNYIKLEQYEIDSFNSFSKNINTYEITDILDWYGNLKAYEVALFDAKKNAKGYINIPVEDGNPVVSTSFYDGYSLSNSLKIGFKDTWKKLVADNKNTILEQRILGASSGAYGLFFTTINPLKNLDKYPHINKYENGYIFAYMPFYMVKNNIDIISSNYDSSDISFRSATEIQEEAQFKKETDNFRKQLLDGTIKSLEVERNSIADILKNDTSFRSSPKSGNVSGNPNDTEGKGYEKFSAYNQEKKFDDDCYTGCTPVAFGILLEYWDRHGYPAMVGSTTKNNYKNHLDPVVKGMLRTLRAVLGTFCTSEGWGSTYIKNNTNVISYIFSRGYFSWRALNSRYGKADPSAWNLLKYEINNGRPLVAAIASSGSKKSKNADHSVVAYSYVDNPGRTNDKACYIYGWGQYASLTNKPYKCENRQAHFSTTVVAPKAYSDWYLILFYSF